MHKIKKNKFAFQTAKNNPFGENSLNNSLIKNSMKNSWEILIFHVLLVSLQLELFAQSNKKL